MQIESNEMQLIVVGTFASFYKFISAFHIWLKICDPVSWFLVSLQHLLVSSLINELKRIFGIYSFPIGMRITMASSFKMHPLISRCKPCIHLVFSHCMVFPHLKEWTEVPVSFRAFWGIITHFAKYFRVYKAPSLLSSPLIPTVHLGEQISFLFHKEGKWRPEKTTCFIKPRSYSYLKQS